jgi:lysophospholipase L1-like esterase
MPGRQSTAGILHRAAILLLLGLAALGAVVVIDGVRAEQRQHQIFSAAAGAALALPLLGYLALGRTWLGWLKKLLFGLVPVTLLCVGLELGARVVGVETLRTPELEPDPVLSFRMVPGIAGLDAWGFRNAAVPERTDVVFLGDSQTYGFGVTRSEAYPRVFEGLSGVSAYNMGVGAYGPLQYLALAERAVALQPRAVVVALYLGNDLLDAHHMLALPHWSSLRSPELQYRELPDVAAAPTPADARSLAIRAIFSAERHSRLMGWAGKQVRLSLRTNQLLSNLHQQEPGAPEYLRGAIRTRFTPAYRAQSLDPARDRVRDGLRVSAVVLERIQHIAARAGARTSLLLLHTKEHYYHELMRRRGELTGWALDEVARMEAEMTRRLTEKARQLDIPVLDATEPMVGALAADRATYPATADGHPTAAGHAVIAELLWSQRALWLDDEGLAEPAPIAVAGRNPAGAW